MKVLDNTSLKNLSDSPSVSVFEANELESNRLLACGVFADQNIKFFNLITKGRVKEGYSIKYNAINSSDDVAQNAGELSVLSGKTLRNLLVKYPYRSKYVMFRVSIFNPSLYLGLLGLVRRYFLGRRYTNGKITFHSVLWPNVSLPYLYVVLENRNSTTTTHYSVSSALGYRGFLDYLNGIGANYVVLRFFDKLPQKHREGGDLDILVSDEVYAGAANFLSLNSGSEMVDMYSVTGPANAARIPYYTPFLARKLLAETEDKNGYRVPTQENYLNSLIYHCLYHKGLSSGIPTKYRSLTVSDSPDNDYLAVISDLGSSVGVSCGKTLEELDAYMKSVEWRPHLDTLELISPTNKWLSKHLESEKMEPEIGLLACVLKRGFFDNHDINSFREALQAQGLRILVDEALVEGRLQLASDHLRGGNWSSTNDETYYPGHIFLLYDDSVYGRYVRSLGLPYNPRSKKLKLRLMYDVDQESHIHMTDSTHQTIEYIDVLFAGRFKELKDEIFNNDKQHAINSDFLQGVYYRIIASALSVRNFAKSVISKIVRRLV